MNPTTNTEAGARERYAFTDGRTMQRERGNAGPWVLRDPQGQEVDRDRYRYDIFGRHGISGNDAHSAWLAARQEDGQ